MLYYNINTNEEVSEEKTISFDKEITTEDGSTSMVTFRQRLLFIDKSYLENSGFYPVEEEPLPETFNSEIDTITNYTYQVDNEAKVVKKIPVISSISKEEMINFIKKSLKEITNSFSNDTITVMYTVNGVDYKFQADRISENNISNLVRKTASVGVDEDGNEFVPTREVRTADNTFVKMTKQDLEGLHDVIINAGTSLYENKWKLEVGLETKSDEILRTIYLFAKNNPKDATILTFNYE